MDTVSDCTPLVEVGATGGSQGSSAVGSSLAPQCWWWLQPLLHWGSLGQGGPLSCPLQKGSWEGCVGWEGALDLGGIPFLPEAGPAKPVFLQSITGEEGSLEGCLLLWRLHTPRSLCPPTSQPLGRRVSRGKGPTSTLGLLRHRRVFCSS